MKIMCTKGTPEQFLDAVERQIDYLGGHNVESSCNTDKDIKESDNITSASYISDMYEDTDGSFIGVGEQISYEDLRKIYDEDKEDDPVIRDYDSFDDWLHDTVVNGYLKPVEGACNSCNMISGADSFELSNDEMDKLYEIADSYTASSPVSGDWNTEIEHEQQAIADAFNVSLEDAKQMMINYLGFDRTMFEDAAVNAAAEEKAELLTYDVVEAASDDDDIEDDDTDYDDIDDRQDYINQLSDKLNEWGTNNTLGPDNYEIDSVLMDDGDDDVLYITITYVTDDGAQVLECELPYEDLTFGDIEEDFDYIVDEINRLVEDEAL